MGDDWTEAQEKVNAAGGDGLFVKLEHDGQSVVGCFLGKPEVRILHYTGSTYEPYTEAHEAAGKPKTPRTAVNFYVPNERRIKIYEMNKTTFKSVVDVREKYGFDEWFFEIKRNGAKNDKNTTYRVLPETKIDAEHRAIIAGLKLYDLKKMRDDDDAATDFSSHDKKVSANGANTAASAASTQTQAPAESTIDSDTSTSLVNRLKILPNEKLKQFLASFDIKQVKMLPSKSLPNAIRLLEKLEGKPEAPPPAAASQEIDPFS